MKRIFVFIATLMGIYSEQSHAQYTTQDSIRIQQLGNYTLTKGTAYQELHTLCKKIGHRLSGSEQSEKAIAWAQQALKDTGADTVWLQPVMVPYWERGEESLTLHFDKNEIEVPILSLGNTEGTKGKPIKANIIMFNTLDDLKKASELDIKGKIVFLNVHFPKDVYTTFEGYGRIASNRREGVNIASKKGAVGFLLRSISTSKHDLPHTGMSHYEDHVNKIPAMAIGTQTADKLAAQITQKKPIQATMLSNCTMKGMKLSYNVIGELKGNEKPNEYILVGGHLDSWDVGEGAHDDGAGCVHAIQVLQSFKGIGYTPKHTLRVVLFMNEENGVKGGLAYADSAKAKKEKHTFALESDAGAFTPRGIGMMVPDAYRAQALTWLPLLQPFGIWDLHKEGCGVDIRPLQKLGIKVGELRPDSQRYFDFHHNSHDVFEAVNERELLLGAASITAFLYLADQYWD